MEMGNVIIVRERELKMMKNVPFVEAMAGATIVGERDII